MISDGIYQALYHLQVVTDDGVAVFTNTGAEVLAPIESAEVRTRRGSISTAKVVIPQIEGINESTFRQHQVVLLRMGHRGFGLQTVFDGYVREARLMDTTVELDCEDAAWMLQNVPAAVSYRDQGIDSIIRQLIAEAVAAAPQFIGRQVRMEAGQLTVQGSYTSFALAEEATIWDGLSKIADDFSLDAHFEAGTTRLFVGPPFSAPPSPDPPALCIGLNILDGSDYQQRMGDLVGSVIVRGAAAPGSERRPMTATYGSGAPAHTVDLDGDLSQAQLLARAEHLYRQLNSMQFTGRLVTVGRPELRHSDYVTITRYDDLLKRHTVIGDYPVSEVAHTFAGGGYTSTVTLADTL